MENTLPVAQTINLPSELPPDSHQIVHGEQLISYYKEIFSDIQEDRNEVGKVLDNFLDMVMNQGDSTESSKEAVVNLIKVKSDIADKKTRVLDLLIRSFNRDRSIPGYMAKQIQVNNFADNSNKRNLLNSLDEEESGKSK